MLSHGILLAVAYDGTDYHGYALQPQARTVAGELLTAVQSIDPSVTQLRGVSRTDAGVHARGQLVAFDTQKLIAPRGWVLGLSARLPSSIAPRCAAAVPAGFEPRKHSVCKHYRYSLLLDTRRDPFWDRLAWRLGGPMNWALAQAEAKTALGTHDFAAFRSSADERTSTERTLFELRIGPSAQDPRLCFVDVWGSAFLHNMVRILVGSLVDTARGKLAPGAFERAFASGNRESLGVTAPAHGLSLEQVWLNHPVDPAQSWPVGGMGFDGASEPQESWTR